MSNSGGVFQIDDVTRTMSKGGVRLVFHPSKFRPPPPGWLATGLHREVKCLFPNINYRAIQHASIGIGLLILLAACTHSMRVTIDVGRRSCRPPVELYISLQSQSGRSGFTQHTGALPQICALMGLTTFRTCHVSQVSKFSRQLGASGYYLKEHAAD